MEFSEYLSRLCRRPNAEGGGGHMNKDRDIVKALSGYWHERISSRLCSCGFVPTGFEIIESHISYNNPDFTSDTGKVQLLREMIKKRGGKGWINYIDEIGQMEYDKETDTIRVSLILDTTGKLRDAAWEWLRKEATDEPT